MKKIRRIPAAGLMLLLAGCGQRLPIEYPASDFKVRDFDLSVKGDAGDKPLVVSISSNGKSQEVPYFGSPVQQSVSAFVNAAFPPPWTWQTGLPKSVSNADSLKRGQRLYQSNCVQCHGLAGGGDGEAALWLNPKPRDYRRGRFKWKSTKLAAKPTREDLLAVLKNGTLGASMPSFRLMPDEDLNSLVDYVIYLTQRGELERQLVSTHVNGDSLTEANLVAEKRKSIESEWLAAAGQVIKPESAMPEFAPDSAEYNAAVNRGKAIFLGEDAACYKCHGRDGRADPSQIAKAEFEKMIDDWGNRNTPRNLNYGLYRGGRHPLDLFRRVHQGIASTAMPGQGANPKLKPDQLWDVVYFIKELPHHRELLLGK